MSVTDRFKDLTNYEIIVFFNDFNNFVNNNYSYIVSYYSGSYTPTKQAFTELERLIKEAAKIEEIFALNKDILSEDTSFWDLLDDFTTIKEKLLSIKNTAKWLRSSYVYGYDKNSKVNVILSQNQTIESLASDLGYKDENNDWINLSVDNYIKEIDYNSEGGNSLTVSKYNNNKMNTEGVVDIMINDNILGKDLNKKPTIINDDWNYLTPSETIIQAAQYYLTIMKRSIPEFPTIGISKDLLGSNIMLLRASSMWRQLTELFKTDKSFAKIEITDTKIEQDMAFYEVKIVSVLNNELNEQIPINP
jgi:hypothetical protein